MPTEIYTLSLHDALPIWSPDAWRCLPALGRALGRICRLVWRFLRWVDRKSTRLNSSHANISYAVFCLKKNTGRCAMSRVRLNSDAAQPVDIVLNGTDPAP